MKIGRKKGKVKANVEVQILKTEYEESNVSYWIKISSCCGPCGSIEQKGRSRQA